MEYGNWDGLYFRSRLKESAMDAKKDKEKTTLGFSARLVRIPPASRILVLLKLWQSGNIY